MTLFVWLSKTLDLLVDPAAWAIALGLLAIALRRRPRASLALAVAAPLLLWAFSAEWTADTLAGLAEEGAHDTSRNGMVYDAVIVLGGAMDPEGSEAKGRLELNAAADRYVAAFELLRIGRARTALLSAGSLSPRQEAPREAELAARMLERWGVEPERLVVEAVSRNTRENAVESLSLIHI